MGNIKFKQIFAERDLLYGLAEDGAIWVCKIRASTDNGINLKLGELLDEWGRIPSPQIEIPEPNIR